VNKRSWYKLGLIFSIILAVIFFLITIYILNTGHSTLVGAQRDSIIASFLFDLSRSYVFGSKYPLLLLNLLNPFWIGIVIFGVLLSKTK